MTDHDGSDARRGDPLAPALWFLVADAGHVGCGGWRIDRREGHLRCACGTVLYEFHSVGRTGDGPVREQERRDRRADPDSGPDGTRPVRAVLPDLVAEMLALRVPCPWCGAAADRPCTLRGHTRPLRRTVAHPARLAAAGSLPVAPPPRDHHPCRSGTGPAVPTDEKAPL